MNSTSNIFGVSIVAAQPGVSPDGTIIKNVGEVLLAADKSKWVVVGNATPDIDGQIGLTRNGVQIAFSVNFATIKTGVVFVQDQDPGGQPYWLNWNGTGLVRGVAPA